MGFIAITSGSLRGRRVQTPAGGETRPLLTRLRKSLADILRPRLPGTRILDLFGGSGAISFELLSNGASAAVIVELSPKTATLIATNARDLGLASAVEVVPGDGIAAVHALAQKKACFDIIIVAPPYGLGLQHKALAALAGHPLVTPDGLIIVQREDSEEQVAPPRGLALTRSRSYGRTQFDFYENARADAQHP